MIECRANGFSASSMFMEGRMILFVQHSDG